MPRWEYRRLDLNELPRNTDAIDLLNDAGNDGWELAHVTANNIAFLKPQIDEPAPAKAARRKPATSGADRTWVRASFFFLQQTAIDDAEAGRREACPRLDQSASRDG